MPAARVSGVKYHLLILIHLSSIGSLLGQELVLNGGIYFEKPLPKDTTKHKYSRDNISYKINSVFIFDYYYLDKDGSRKKFLHTKSESSKDNPLNLAGKEDQAAEIIDKIKIDVHDYLEMLAFDDPDYTQTAFSYTYLKRNGKGEDTLCEKAKKKNPKFDMPCGDETTGVVDNSKNLWMHPPREFTFKILQLNPFPFYYRDENVQTWSWNLETGGLYLDPRWVTPQKGITVHYSYQRLPDETIDTPFGKIKCKVTDGFGSCKLKDGELKTHLKSFYHPDYGFVRLEYDNINGTQLIMQLVEAR